MNGLLQERRLRRGSYLCRLVKTVVILFIREKALTSSTMPFASRILTAPLWYISSLPISPSTCAGGFSLSTSSGTAAGGFVSAENETCLPSLAVGGSCCPLVSGCVGGCDWEANVGKGAGNWKKYRRPCRRP